MAELVHNQSKSDDESKSEMDAESNGETEFVQTKNDLEKGDDIITRNVESLIRIHLTCASSDRKAVTAIGKCVHLQALNVCTCILQNETFGTELQKCVELHSLSISRHMCCRGDISRDANQFLRSMENNTKLLNVKFCDILIQGTTLKMFLSKCPNLEFVQVHNCIMNMDGDFSFENWFSASLTHLLFTHIKFGDQGAIALAAILPQCVNLVVLDLTQNNIGDAGASELIKTLPESLKKLTLTSNKITGLRFFSPLPTNLRELNLNDNKICDIGIYNVVSALQPFNGLQLLNLERNCITEDGINFSVDMLPLCYDLHCLYLSFNSIKDDGAIALAKVLPDCKNISELILKSTNITDTGVSAFIEVLSRCGRLRRIDLYGNDIMNPALLTELNFLLQAQQVRYVMVAKPDPNKTNWNRRRHIFFGQEINKLFAAFISGFFRLIMKDDSAVPYADPEMIEETLETLHHYGLTVFNLLEIIEKSHDAEANKKVKRRYDAMLNHVFSE